MDFWRSRRTRHHQQLVEPQPKRISTPAGQRLSVILENGGDPSTRGAREAHRESVRRSGLPAVLGDGESTQDSKNSGYSYSVWSDGEKKGGVHTVAPQKGRRKRIIIIVALVICAIIALAVGVAVGVSKGGGSKSSSKNGSQEASDSDSSSGSNSQSTPTGTATNTVASSLPSNFPQGSYSMVTFLDTVQTNCTSNPSTWTCYPYTEYNTSPSKSVATFNWIIGTLNGKLTITSTDNPFDISFKNADLELLDEGKSTERYRFQISSTKTVTADIDGKSADCDFQYTSTQAYLYTKMAKTYPDTDTGDPTGDPSFPEWPFAVRVEQAVGGGESTPSCSSSGKQISMDAQDAGNLCSCLYKNWRTPT
ncbi:hypothetical protein BS50DRAFT_381727 [Corynespora cassiicola Philippines]|uniref:Tat pathway signal sequence n=1 Tax=Corynespora cassiicola Philippines TaxID=1448308 RepID=A0A2T2NNT4_CORCC|nr:hypothetical protein BS50DRAFT_381727 [Corynespora cassiicola Philippines]